MAQHSHKIFKVCFALVLICSPVIIRADAEDSDDGVTVEVEEEEYKSPQVDPKTVYFAEHFDDVATFNKRWVRSEAKKQGVDENIAKYDGIWEIQNPSKKIFKDDLGLVLTTQAKHAAISALLDRPFQFNGKPLVVQYEVTMQDGLTCGGAYVKLLSRGSDKRADLKQFYDQTPYTVMFGPDMCGANTALHFIFRHTNPLNGTVQEKHAKKPTMRLESIYKDKEPHLYTLIVRPDNTFAVLVDGNEANSGSLLEDFTPPVNPPEEIDDPNDSKPNDWDEREKIVDPTATKPEDWDEDAPATIVDPNAVKPDGWLDDEPEMIPDPEAVKPADWDEDMDGEWEAPLIDNPRCASAPGCGPWAAPTIPNPAYKGPWRAPLVSNPNYRGKWVPRRIPNPEYFRDDHPYKMTPIHAIGFELWSMSPQLLFDNLLVTDDIAVAEDFAKNTFHLKRAKLSRDSRTWWGRLRAAIGPHGGWWALYGVWVGAPLLAYVVCLLRTAAQESGMDRALQWLSANPAAAVAGALASFALLALAAYYCCAPRRDSDAETKKTDEFVEDDPHSEGEEEARDSEEAQEPTGKASLEDLTTETSASEDIQTTPPIDTEGAGDGQRKRKPRRE